MPSVPDRSWEEPPWRLWTAPAAVVFGLALGVFATIAVELLARIGGSDPAHLTATVNIIGDVVFDLAFVAAALYFAALHGRPRPGDFGFRRIPPRLAIKAFVVAAVGYYALTAAYASVLRLHGSDKLPVKLGSHPRSATLALLAVFVCVIAPMAEEFFFRGFFFGALRRWRIVIAGRNVGTLIAAVLTGILFGLAHTGSASSAYLIPLGFLGFVLCVVRWRTGSLYPCMALHSANNALALGVTQLHWSALEILGLMAGSLLVIGAATGPLAPRAALAR
ncbi:MAG: CPBP family intramembrane metalloprotease [Solirubrobacterales bacterium]|nr:CPBP family intramembrane metalloprotease [Solirubrobacterales bacterium]